MSKIDIKKVKPSGNYIHGLYIPVNPLKYIGDINNIIFRSSWEKKFCIYCDKNPKVLKWSSEPVCIKYWSPVDKKEKSYNIDYFIKVEKDSGETENWFIEVKPKSQYAIDQKPEIKSPLTEKKLKAYNDKMKMWITNRAKMEAGIKYAESLGYRFGTINEDFLFK
jgi:hypothetical protein